MPNQLSAVLPGLAQVTHDPTKTLHGDPMSFLGENPFAEMTDEIIFGSVNTLLGWIDAATGLDLVDAAHSLEGLLGIENGLLSGLLGWLTPGLGTAGGGVFGPILSGTGLGTLGQFTGLFLGLPGTIIGSIESAEQEVVDAVLNGIAGTSGVVGNAIGGIAWFLLEPLRILGSVQDGLGSVYQELSALHAKLEGRVLVLENNKADKTTTLGSVHDPCESVAGFTTISGMSALVSNGSSIRSPGIAGGYHTVGPLTDSHGVRFTLSRKIAGTLHILICSDTAASDYFGLRIHCDGFGNDYVRAITGDSPTNWVNVGDDQWSNRISETWTWDTYYDLATNMFHTSLNNQELPELFFEDVGGLVTHGSTKRNVVVISNFGNSIVFPGPAVADIVIYDRQP